MNNTGAFFSARMPLADAAVCPAGVNPTGSTAAVSGSGHGGGRNGALEPGSVPLQWLLGALVCFLLATAPGAVRSAELEVGDMAPDFSLQASDGETYTLADFRGEQAVVLAWFPRAFTSGCTVECKSLAENGDRIREFDVTYFMASTDPVEKNSEFAADTGADFPLLSDPDGSIAEAYGVFTRGFARRHTFYIDVNGVITHIDRNVKPSTSAEDMIATLEALEVARSES